MIKEEKASPPVKATLTALTSSASPRKVKAGSTSTVTATATGSDGKPFSGAALTATAEGGTVGRVQDLGGGAYSVVATAAKGATSMAVTLREGTVSTTAWITVEEVVVVPPPVSTVSLRFSCIGCSDESIMITDGTGAVSWAASTGEYVSVAVGALSISYGGVRNDVSVSSSSTKVKCTQAGCKVY